MESTAYKLGIWAISWQAWLLQRHVWEILPLRVDDMDDQVSRADLVRQLLAFAIKQESSLAIGQVCVWRQP